MSENALIMRYPPDLLRQCQRDLITLSKPYVQLKCDILAVNIPTMIRYADGHIEQTYSLEVQESLARVDTLWEEAKDRFLLSEYPYLVEAKS